MASPDLRHSPHRFGPAGRQAATPGWHVAGIVVSSHTMRKDTTIPFRLDAGTKQRLQAAADRMGLSTSALIRILIDSFVRSFEASGGRTTLPLDWPPPRLPDFPPPSPRARR